MCYETSKTIRFQPFQDQNNRCCIICIVFPPFPAQHQLIITSLGPLCPVKQTETVCTALTCCLQRTHTYKNEISLPRTPQKECSCRERRSGPAFHYCTRRRQQLDKVGPDDKSVARTTHFQGRSDGRESSLHHRLCVVQAGEKGRMDSERLSAILRKSTIHFVMGGHPLRALGSGSSIDQSNLRSLLPDQSTAPDRLHIASVVLYHCTKF